MKKRAKVVLDVPIKVLHLSMALWVHWSSPGVFDVLDCEEFFGQILCLHQNEFDPGVQNGISRDPEFLGPLWWLPCLEWV